MTERELLKKAADRNLPDFEQVRAVCLTEPCSKEKKPAAGFRFFIPAVCAAAVCALLLLPQMNQEPPVSNEEESASNPSAVEAQEQICFHEISSVPEIKHSIGLFWDDFIAFSKEELCSYYGMEVFAVQMPADLKLKKSLYGVFRRDKGTGALYCDSNSLCYQNADGSRQLALHLSKEAALPADIIIDYGEEKSVIGGTSVSLGARQNTDGGTEYYAAFSNGDTNVALLSSGLSQEEFLDTVRSAVKQRLNQSLLG